MKWVHTQPRPSRSATLSVTVSNPGLGYALVLIPMSMAAPLLGMVGVVYLFAAAGLGLAFFYFWCRASHYRTKLTPSSCCTRRLLIY